MSITINSGDFVELDWNVASVSPQPQPMGTLGVTYASGNATLSWISPVGIYPNGHYTLEQSISPNVWTQLAAPAGTVVQQVVPAPNTTVTYRLTGFKPDGTVVTFNLASLFVPKWGTVIKPTVANSHAYVIDVAIDSSKNTVVVGYFNGTEDFGGTTKTSAGGYDVFVAKYSPTGTLLWVNSYGDTSDQYADAVAIDKNDRIIVTGHYKGAPDFGGGPLYSDTSNFHFFIAVFNSAGVHQWSIPHTELFYGTSCLGLATDPTDNTIVIAGIHTIDTTFGDCPNPSTDPYCVHVHNISDPNKSGHIFVASYTPGSSGVPGTLNWKVNIGNYSNQDGLTGVAIDANGDVYISGYTYNNSVNVGSGTPVSQPAFKAALIAKYAKANGSYKWAKLFGNSGAQLQANGIAIEPSSGPVIVGSISGAADFGSGTATNATAGLFMASYDANGSYLYSKVIDSSDGLGVSANAVVTDSIGNIFITGNVPGTVNFGSGVPSGQNGTQTAFVARYTSVLVYGGHIIFGGDATTSPTSQGFSLVCDTSGAIYVNGQAAGSINFGSGNTVACDGFIVEYPQVLQ